MLIRDEPPSDIAALDSVTMAAFAGHPFSQQTEQFIVKALRAAGALTVSLVAEDDGQVKGHIAFSPMTRSKFVVRVPQPQALPPLFPNFLPLS